MKHYPKPHMKRSASLLSALLITSAAAFGGPATNELVGNWKGTLEAGQARLRVLFKVSRSPAGVLTAKMDSLDQGARDIPVETVVTTNNTVRMEVDTVHGVYEGAFDASGKKITGTWHQGPGSLPLTLERTQGTVAAAEPEKLSPAELAASKQAAQKLAGVWNGTLTAGAANLRLKVTITKSATGAATGTMESVDQGAREIPITGITCKEGAVRFEARGIRAFYEGTLSPAGVVLTGQWNQSGQSAPLELKKAAVAR
jgi:hypothetical protein